jgi:hypothetical protein
VRRQQQVWYRPPVAARPGRRGRPIEEAAAGLVVRPSAAAQLSRRGKSSEEEEAGKLSYLFFTKTKNTENKQDIR